MCYRNSIITGYSHAVCCCASANSSRAKILARTTVKELLLLYHGKWQQRSYKQRLWGRWFCICLCWTSTDFTALLAKGIPWEPPGPTCVKGLCLHNLLTLSEAGIELLGDLGWMGKQRQVGTVTSPSGGWVSISRLWQPVTASQCLWDACAGSLGTKILASRVANGWIEQPGLALSTDCTAAHARPFCPPQTNFLVVTAS